MQAVVTEPDALGDTPPTGKRQKGRPMEPHAEPEQCVVGGCDAAVRRTSYPAGAGRSPDHAKCDRGHRLHWVDGHGWQANSTTSTGESDR